LPTKITVAQEQSKPPRRGSKTIAVVAVCCVAVAALLGAGYFFVTKRSHDDAGRAVAGQLRNTFPDRPSTGWRVNAGAIFEGAAFVRPDATSYQYLRPGFIDLGDTLITSAVLPQTDRSATLVAIDAESGAVKWAADAGFHPVCATATVDGLLPCLGQESNFGPPGTGAPPYVHFLQVSDGAVAHRIAVPEETRAVEVHESAVYTTSYDYAANIRSITRGTTDALDATWRRTYPVGDGSQSCPGSGDTTYDGVDHDVVYSGNDGGMVVADAADGARLLPGEVTELKVFPGQGFTARRCDGGEPDTVDTVVVDTQGNVLREVTGAVADPWLVDPEADVPYIAGRTAYDFATGREVWTAAGGSDLHTIVGDTVLGGGGRDDGPLTAFDLATGRQLWTSHVAVGDFELSDGRRVMAVTADGLVAIDLATGREAWSLSWTDDRTFVGRAGTGFADAAADAITFYPPTGGPAGTPGRAGGDEAVAASAGSVTRCGRTPELRPVEYRAENGALIVTMEVKARCPGGDVVSTNRMRVTIRDERGLICSATFDFSQDPLVLGPVDSGPVLVELTFDSGTGRRQLWLRGDLAGAIVSAVREVTNNVDRHAHANTIRIDVAEDRVTIVDDGIGFTPGAGLSGHGIRASIVGRMNRVGGSGSVRSAPAQGTVAELSWPAHRPISASVDAATGADRLIGRLRAAYTLALTAYAIVGLATAAPPIAAYERHGDAQIWLIALAGLCALSSVPAVFYRERRPAWVAACVLAVIAFVQPALLTTRELTTHANWAPAAVGFCLLPLLLRWDTRRAAGTLLAYWCGPAIIAFIRDPGKPMLVFLGLSLAGTLIPQMFATLFSSWAARAARDARAEHDNLLHVVTAERVAAALQADHLKRYADIMAGVIPLLRALSGGEPVTAEMRRQARAESRRLRTLFDRLRADHPLLFEIRSLIEAAEDRGVEVTVHFDGDLPPYAPFDVDRIVRRVEQVIGLATVSARIVVTAAADEITISVVCEVAPNDAGRDIDVDGAELMWSGQTVWMTIRQPVDTGVEN
jgi:hypothetical protein